MQETITTGATLRQRRLHRLDVLRAIAVLLVLGRHMRPPGPGVPGWIAGAADALATCGWIGVDLFFVLSGFLVSSLLFREYIEFGEVRGIHFLIRRGLKIYPGFYCLLIATVLAWQVPALHHMKWMEDLTWSNFAVEAVFLGNYLPNVWNHTWSLAIEEHFYIGLTLLFVILARRKTRTPFAVIPSIFVATAVAVLVCRMATWYFVGGNYAPTHLRIDSLLFGVAIAYFYHYDADAFAPLRKRFWISVSIALSIGAVVAAMIIPLDGGNFWFTAGFTFLYLVFGLLLIAVLNLRIEGAVARSWLGRGLAYVGFYSYAIYLWHMPVRRGLFLIFDRLPFAVPYALQGALFVVAALAAGIVMGKLIEVPVLVLRDRVFPSRSTAPV